MSQFDAIPQSGPKTGAEMAAAIQGAVDAINSGHLGTGRPSYAVQGTVWHDDVSSSVAEVYVFDGTTDIFQYSYNPTTGALIEVAVPDNTLPVAKLQQIATQRILGRTTASTGNVEVLTPAQVMAMLPDMIGDSGAGGTAGRAPAPGAGDAAANYFLGADGTWKATPSGSEPGLIGAFAMETPPSGWLLCYGQAVSRSTYSALFAAIGIVFGPGNGSTTFNLPDYRGRVIAGWDQMGGASANRLTGQTGGVNGDTLGATGGAETHTLQLSEIPNHAHTLTYRTGTDGTSGVGRGFGATASAATTSVGGGGAHNNVQPTAIALICIKT